MTGRRYDRTGERLDQDDDDQGDDDRGARCRHGRPRAADGTTACPWCDDPGNALPRASHTAQDAAGAATAARCRHGRPVARDGTACSACGPSTGRWRTVPRGELRRLVERARDEHDRRTG